LRSSSGPFYAVDIRLPEEFRAGHSPGSISSPAGQLALQHENFLAARRAPVVVLSDDPVRPIWAAALCQDLGFASVSVLAGGIRAWAAAGHALDLAEAFCGSSDWRKHDDTSRPWTRVNWTTCELEMREFGSSTFAAVATSGPGTYPARTGWPAVRWNWASTLLRRIAPLQ